jgi:fibronectin-binding autotransporter adhesin
MSFKTRRLCLLTSALVTIPGAAFMMTPAYADCVSGGGNTVTCSGTNDVDGFTSGSGLTLTNTGITVSNPTGNALTLGLSTTIINQTGGIIQTTAGTGNAINVNSVALDNQAGGAVSSSVATAIQINSVAGNVSTISNSGNIAATGGSPSVAIADGAGDITITNNSGGAITGDLSLGAGHNVVSLQGGSTLTGNITADSTGTNQLFLGGAGNGILSSTLTNFPTLVKDGTGIWTETVANSFSGGITVIQGTLSGGGSILNGGSSTPNNIDDQIQGTVDFSDAVSGTYAGVISGAGAVTKTGAGTTTITGANSYTGGTTVSVGTLIVTNVGATTALALPGNVVDNAILDFNTANGGTYAGVISGTGKVGKDGAGTLALSGVNTYTGKTYLLAGELSISAANNLGTSPQLVFSGGALQTTSSLTLTQDMTDSDGVSAAILDINGAGNTTTAGGIISAAGGLTKNGLGTLVLTGVNTYTGATDLNAGILSISAANNLGASSGIVFAGGELDTTASFTITQGLSGASDANINVVGGGTTTTASGVISNTASLVKTGAGTLVLSGVNTYTGATDINAGILSISAANNLGASSGIVFGGGELDTTASLTIAQDMSGTGTNINTVGAGNTTTASGVISGTGTLTKTGAGTLVITAANTYSGGTTISAGTLEVDNVGDTTALALPGDVTDNANLDFNTANGGTYAGVISGTGNVAKDGAATLVLSGVNTYSGTTTLNAGELSVSAAENLGNSSGIVFGGGELQTTGAGFTVTQGMSGSSDANIDVAGAGNTTTASGVISNTGSLVKNGLGTLVLTGVNTYTGTTAINTGILSISAANNLGNSSGIWFGSSGELDTTASMTISQGISGAGDANINVVGAGVTTTSTGVISNTNLNKLGLGTLVLSGVNTFSTLNLTAGEVDTGAANGIADTAAVVISTPGTLKLTGNETIGSLASATDETGSVDTNGFGLTTGDAADTTFAGVISGAGTVTTAGTGNFTLTGANTYTGLTTVNGGMLTLNNAGGNTLALDGNITVTTGTLSVLTNQTSDAVNSAAPGIISVGTGVNLTVGDAGGNSTLSGVVSGAGTITKMGAGTVDFSAANTVAAIDVEAGTANLNATNTVPSVTVNGGTLNLTAADVISDTGTLTVNGGTVSMNPDETVGALAGTGGTIVNNDSTLTVAGVNASPTTFAGVISGAGGLIKTGAGTLALSGVNTYTGDTMVNGGELALTSTGVIGSGGASATTIASGADLRVNGTLYGAVVNNGTLNGSGTIVGNVINNAILSPGNSPGIMTITGNYTQTSTGTLAVDIHAGATPATPVAGTDYDQLNISGTGTLAGTIAATVQPGLYATGATYTLVTAGGGFGGTNFTTVTGLPTQGFITFTPSVINDLATAQSYVWTVTRLAYNTAATTPNQIATANALQSAVAGATAAPNSDMASVLTALDGSSNAQAAAFFTSANGSYYGSFLTANQTLGSTFTKSINSRAASSKGGGWVDANYHWGKGNSTTNESGADIDNYGIAAGVDYAVAQNVLAGIAVGYGHANINGRDNLASGHSKGWQVGGYLSFNQSGFALTGALAYQDTKGDARRMITGLTGLASRTATSNPDGKNYLASLEVNYKVDASGGFGVVPFAGIKYNKAEIKAFNESGANALDLNVDKMTGTSTRLYGGLEVSGNVSSGSTSTISPFARIAYSEELSGNHRDITAMFAGGGSAFTVTGRQPSKGQVDLSAGINASLSANVTVSIAYDGELRGDLKSHGVNAGLRFGF